MHRHRKVRCSRARKALSPSYRQHSFRSHQRMYLVRYSRRCSLRLCPSNRQHTRHNRRQMRCRLVLHYSLHTYCYCRCTPRRHQAALSQPRRLGSPSHRLRRWGSVVLSLVGLLSHTPQASCWAVPPHTLLQSCRHADPLGRTVLSFDASLSQTPQSS